MNTVKLEKDAARAKYGALRKAIGDGERARRDGRITLLATSMASFQYARHVLLYAAIGGEITMNAVAEEALRRGKAVYFPVCDKETATMEYRRVGSLDELAPGAYGIPEPPADAPLFCRETDGGQAVCFVPGLVFDKAGYRVGYGKGYYDRYLTDFHGSTIGVVYSDFVLPSVPRGRFDRCVDTLLTERGVRLADREK